MSAATPTDVVTGFVVRDSRVLLLRRSAAVGSYRGMWAGVSGYLEVPSAREQMWMELGEELGVGRSDAALVAEGEPLVIEDGDRYWRVHPFRLDLAPGVEPRLDWEHVELAWIAPEEIRRMDTVPGLWDAWGRVSG